jgi:Flp pilus assembly protein protease CpaA
LRPPDVALHNSERSLLALLYGPWRWLLGLSGWAAGAVAGRVGAATWPVWARGWLGGGDLKLGAAAAAWIGLGDVVTYVLASAVAVGLVSIACYAASARTARRTVRRNLAAAARGVSIAVSLEVRMAHSGWFGFASRLRRSR